MKLTSKIAVALLAGALLSACAGSKIPDSLQEYGFNVAPQEVRNDETGTWEYTTISKSSDPADWAVEYAQSFMDDGSVHAVINFANDTTTRLTRNGDTLQVQTLEHVDKEEHDAKTLFSGEALTDTENYSLSD